MERKEPRHCTENLSLRRCGWPPLGTGPRQLRTHERRHIVRRCQRRGDYSMLRRSFCRAVVGILVAPGFAIAQASKGIRRIGRLERGAPLTPEDIRKEVDALREFG
jgi:hypothetical protein